MALNIKSLEGNELADGYSRTAVPQGRWADTWDLFKNSFFKLVLLNLAVLVTFVPGITLMWFRTAYIASRGAVYPFNAGILYPFYPDVRGLTESVFLSADYIFMSLLIAAGVIASVGISGAAYCVKKLILTHGQLAFKDFFHGIKVCYFKTLLPVTLFMTFLFLTYIVGDMMDLAFATDGNRAAAVTGYVFMILATVLAGMYCGWLFAVGVGYRVNFIGLLKNAGVLFIGTFIQTLFMAAFALIPVWFFMIGGIMRFISYILFIFFGFSFVLLCWLAFSQWAFDLYLAPNVKPAAEKKAAKNDAEKLDDADDEKRIARELLAAGRSELAARPLMPITSDKGIKNLGKTFTRADVSRCAEERVQLGADVSAYESAHLNDPVYAEYNRLFADREKALTDDKNGKKKSKKVSAANLLR